MVININKHQLTLWLYITKLISTKYVRFMNPQKAKVKSYHKVCERKKDEITKKVLDSSSGTRHVEDLRSYGNIKDEFNYGRRKRKICHQVVLWSKVEHNEHNWCCLNIFRKQSNRNEIVFTRTDIQFHPNNKIKHPILNIPCLVYDICKYFWLNHWFFLFRSHHNEKWYAF